MALARLLSMRSDAIPVVDAVIVPREEIVRAATRRRPAELRVTPFDEVFGPEPVRPAEPARAEAASEPAPIAVCEPGPVIEPVSINPAAEVRPMPRDVAPVDRSEPLFAEPFALSFEEAFTIPEPPEPAVIEEAETPDELVEPLAFEEPVALAFEAEFAWEEVIPVDAESGPEVAPVAETATPAPEPVPVAVAPAVAEPKQIAVEPPNVDDVVHEDDADETAVAVAPAPIVADPEPAIVEALEAVGVDDGVDDVGAEELLYEDDADDEIAIVDDGTCKIAVWRGYRKASFYAQARDTQGDEVALAQSPTFRYRGNGLPDKTAEAADAYEALIEVLHRDGWTPVDQGSAWFDVTLTRS